MSAMPLHVSQRERGGTVFTFMPLSKRVSKPTYRAPIGSLKKSRRSKPIYVRSRFKRQQQQQQHYTFAFFARVLLRRRPYRSLQQQQKQQKNKIKTPLRKSF